jgi:hypothetical protein
VDVALLAAGGREEARLLYGPDLVTFTSVDKAEIANKITPVKRNCGFKLWNVGTEAHISQFTE